MGVIFRYEKTVNVEGILVLGLALCGPMARSFFKFAPFRHAFEFKNSARRSLGLKRLILFGKSPELAGD